jgi:Na+/proline symporter
MEYSLPAWLGGLAGTVLAVALYVPAIRRIERRLRAHTGPTTLEARAEFENRLSVYRRLILAADIAILATVGYWIGHLVGGAGALPPRL